MYEMSDVNVDNKLLSVDNLKLSCFVHQQNLCSKQKLVSSEGNQKG